MPTSRVDGMASQGRPSGAWLACMHRDPATVGTAVLANPLTGALLEFSPQSPGCQAV